MNQAPGSIYS
jgi:hypothetical protein